MQITNQISSRHWVAQRPISTAKKRWEMSKSGKQRPDKAQKLDVIVEITTRQNETSEDFQKALNEAILVSSLIINSSFVKDVIQTKTCAS
jgi:hypothetical protein